MAEEKEIVQRKVAIVLDEGEVAQVRIIVQDRDAEAALAFLKEVVKRKLEQAERHLCGPGF